MIEAPRSSPVKRCVNLFLLLSYLSGCSIFGSSTQPFSVSSDPPGANVSINGAAVGTTPLRHEVPRPGDLMVEVQKPGYKTQYRSTSRKLSSLGIVDVVGGAFILLPLFGLLASGAWEQDPSALGITLERDHSPLPRSLSFLKQMPYVRRTFYQAHREAAEVHLDQG